MRLATIIGLAIAVSAAVPGLVAATYESSKPFTIIISAPQTTIKVGDPVRIHVVMTNISDHEVNLLTEFDAGCDYSVQIQGKNNVKTHEPDCSGSAVFLHLKPGKQYESDTDLSIILHYDSKIDDMVKTFDFTSPGEYVVQLSRHISDDPDKELIKSNKITITVTE
jgi:hypothetical protein